MRLIYPLLLATGVLLGGCGSWHLAPPNQQALCDTAGGILTADGRCLAGNL